MCNHDDALDGLITDFNALKKELKRVTSDSYVNNIKADAIELATFKTREAMQEGCPKWLCRVVELEKYADSLRSNVIG